MRFLANFKYAVKPQISKDPTKDGAEEFLSLKTGDYNKFNSHCDKTMVGFVQEIPKIMGKSHTMAQHKVSCFWAEQETHYDMEKTVSVKTESDTVKVAVITNENKIVTDDQSLAEKPTDSMDLQLDEDMLAQVDSEQQAQQNMLAQQKATNEAKIKNFHKNRQNNKQSKRINAHLEHVPSDETDLAISFINSQDFGWKADTCKLQKHHADYGSHCENEEILAQTGSFTDLDDQNTSKANSTQTHKKPQFGDSSKEFKKALEKVQSWG